VSALRVTAIVALATLAVLAALLAADLRAWPAAIERGDALYALDPASAQWSVKTRLGGLAGTMLGTGGDLAARRGLELYDQTIVLQQGIPYQEEIETARAAAINALAAPAASSDPSVASQARTLQGVLAFDAASHAGGPSQVDAAISDFTGALEWDPGDTAAKFDLELLLRLGKAQSSTFSPGPTHERAFGSTGRTGPAGSAGGRTGAAGTPAGHGY
jgi:polyisoprenoid-binding protein YceI